MKTKWLGQMTVKAPMMALCLNEAEYLAACKECGMDDGDEWCDGLSGAKMHSQGLGELYCIVCMNTPDGTNPIEIAALLVHEATHIKQKLMLSIGEKEPSPEFEAYTMQNICQELFCAYAEKISR
jgi:hypothetical protein